MSGTDTVWIAWDCQSSQQLPNINYSPLRRSRVFPSPFNIHSLALQSRELGRGASADPVAEPGWAPSYPDVAACSHRHPSVPEDLVDSVAGAMLL